MAKKNMIEREKKRQSLVLKYSKKRTEIKESIKNSVSFQEKLALYGKFQLLPRNSFPSRLRNRCWMTGRSRG